MLPNSPAFNAASLEMMERVNFASMHSFLLCSSSGPAPEVFRCSMLTPAEVWVKSVSDQKDGCTMVMSGFADFLRSQPDPMVYAASTPDFKSQVSQLIQKVKIDPHFTPDFSAHSHDSPASVYNVSPAITRGKMSPR